MKPATDNPARRVLHVLDHGYVRLVDHMGDDMAVVRSARVSYDAEPRGEDKDRKLLNYLWRNRHTSPFEAVSFTFEVQAPIFVLRQWHRHRTWSYNEVSARYTALPDLYYVPAPQQITTQSSSNKQMRTEERHADAEGVAVAMNNACAEAFRTYRMLLNSGVPRELARSVLPVSTYSRMFATVDLHNLLHFIGLRSHEHAQFEIRVYSDAMLELIEQVVPWTVAAFREGRA